MPVSARHCLHVRPRQHLHLRLLPGTRYDGQEAVAGGLGLAITRQDSIITWYRDHCQILARGGTVKEVSWAAVAAGCKIHCLFAYAGRCTVPSKRC
jgi:hypothetical protein